MMVAKINSEAQIRRVIGKSGCSVLSRGGAGGRVLRSSSPYRQPYPFDLVVHPVGSYDQRLVLVFV